MCGRGGGTINSKGLLGIDAHCAAVTSQTGTVRIGVPDNASSKVRGSGREEC